MAPELEALADRLGHAFGDERLLELAVAHRSWTTEADLDESNERLEFLGDAVLGLAVTDRAYAGHADLPEGDLTKLRAAVVNETTLAEVASEIGLGRALKLGKGEERAGGREKASILSDALEAVVGAVYLDAGWEVARAVVLELVGDRIEAAAEGPGGQDYKTRLQVVADRRFSEPPRYEHRATGPDHAREFYVVVHVDGRVLGSGHGRSKKQAQQAAAREAWTRLEAEQAASDLIEEVADVTPGGIRPGDPA